MPDALGTVYRPPGSGRVLDNTGAAAVLPRDAHTATDEYLNYFENERNRRAKYGDEDKSVVPTSLAGFDTALGEAFDTDKPDLADKLEKIANADVQLTVNRKSGKLNNADYIAGKNQIEAAKTTFRVQGRTSAQDYKNWAAAYNKGEHSYDPGSWQMLQKIPYMSIPERRAALDQVKSIDNIDLTGYFTPKNSIKEYKKGEIDPNTNQKLTEDVQYLDSATLRNEAMQKAMDKDQKGYKAKRIYADQNPGVDINTLDANNPAFVDFIEKQMRTSGKYKTFVKKDIQRAPSGYENANAGLDDMMKSGLVAETVPVNIYNYDKATGKQEDAVSNIKYFMPFALKNETVVTSNKDFIDLSTNKYMDEVESYNFKPAGVGFIKSQRTGKYEKYVIGKITDFTSGRRGRTVTSQGNDLAIPYNQAANVIKGEKIPVKWIPEADKILNGTAQPSGLKNVSDVKAVTLTSQADYDKLPKGGLYYDKNGNIRKKP